jgi:hypothetical protein
LNVPSHDNVVRLEGVQHCGRRIFRLGATLGIADAPWTDETITTEENNGISFVALIAEHIST